MNPPYRAILGIAPSSSADVTRAMRGQPKRRSRNYRRRNGGYLIVYGIISCYGKDVFCTLSRLFVRPGFRLLLCSFGFSLFGRLLGLSKV